MSDLKCIACGTPLPVQVPAMGTYYSLCPICGMEITFRKKQDFTKGDAVKLLHDTEDYLAGNIGIVQSVIGFRKYEHIVNFLAPTVLVTFQGTDGVPSIVKVPEYSLTREHSDKEDKK